jgi:predicted DNA-binding helix-hairpin-helix protein
MLIQIPLDAHQKMALLESAANFDVCGAPDRHETGIAASRSPSPAGVTRVHQPGKGCVTLLKVLMTNECINDCGYCVNQVGRDIRRTGFRPDELAAYFWQLFEARQVTGMFLSSAISHDSSTTMERMLKAVEMLRRRYHFKGYIHLKVMPGASYDYVEQACRLADRVSVNMEAPTSTHLGKLTSHKDLADGIIERMAWIDMLQRENGLAPSGQTTQYVVGVAGETDREIYESSERLYKQVGLRRAYFSAYRPVAGGRLTGIAATPPLREARLYELDWLLRIYHFEADEIISAFGPDGLLPLNRDPKLAIALQRPEAFPIDPNTSDPWELLRVPGFGPVTVQRILRGRKEKSLRSLDDLRKLGVATSRCAPFVFLPEHQPTGFQLPLL